MKISRPKTIQSQLVFSHVLVALLSLSLLLAVVFKTMLETAKEDAEHHLEDLIFAASNSLEDPLKEFLKGERSLLQVRLSLTHLLAEQTDTTFTVFLPDGSSLLDSGTILPPRANQQNAPEVIQALNSTIGEGDRIGLDTQGKERIFVAVRIEHEGQIYGILRLSAPLAPERQKALDRFSQLLALSVLILIGSLASGLLLARSIAHPLEQLRAAAQRLAQGELKTRVTPTGPMEIKTLALTFNNMAEQLQDHVTELRTFVANASHELRTPLTAVKLRTEALRSGGALEDPQIADHFLEDIEFQADRLTHMVNALLDLSRIEAGMTPPKRELLQLARLAEEVCQTYQVRTRNLDVSLVLDISPGLPSVWGDEDQIRRVIENYLDNALKFSSPGNQVTIRLEAHSGRRSVCLTVQDNGPGITSHHLPHIFERFYRADTQPFIYPKPSGSGLGLAIVKSIVEAHGGKVGVESLPGQGATFWMELPY